MIRRSAAGLAAAWLVGLALGLLDAFLEPLRKRHAALADLLLLPAAFRGWLEISFRVCRGDIRMSYTLGMLLGLMAGKWAFGWLLGGLFRGIWALLGRIFGTLRDVQKKFFKKVGEIRKKVFASGKKSGTIAGEKRREGRRENGGSARGKGNKKPGGFPAQRLNSSTAFTNSERNSGLVSTEA